MLIILQFIFISVSDLLKQCVDMDGNNEGEEKEESNLDLSTSVNDIENIEDE